MLERHCNRSGGRSTIAVDDPGGDGCLERSRFLLDTGNLIKQENKLRAGVMGLFWFIINRIGRGIGNNEDSGNDQADITQHGTGETNYV